MNEISLLAILSAILMLTFATRLLPRVVAPGALASDTFFHLGMSRAIRENGHRMPERLPRILVCARSYYPYLLHSILSFVPDRHLLAAERFVSPVIETVYVAAAFFFVREIVARTGIAPSPDETALWVAAGVALSPALVSVGVGPRAYNATPRILSQCLFLFFAGANVLYAVTADPAWLAIAIVASAAIALTSKFGNQVLVFVSAAMLVFGEVAPLIAVALGYLIVIAITRGAAFHVLRNQIAHSSFYVRHMQPRFLTPWRHRFRDYLARGYSAAKSGARGNVFHALRWAFTEPLIYHKIPALYPQLVVLAVLMAGWPEVRAAYRVSPAMSASAALVVVSVLITLLVAQRPLAFLGEAERYAEHTVVFQYALCVLAADMIGLSAVKPALLAYGALAYVTAVKVFAGLYGDKRDMIRHMDQVVATADRDGVRLFWLGNIFWLLWFRTRKASVLVHGALFDERQIDSRSWFEIFGNLPYPGVPVGDISRRYHLHYLVATPDAVKRYEELIGDPSFSDGRFPIMARAGDFILYDIRVSKAA